MTSRDDVLIRVETHLEAGRVWRAKEILRGTISGGRADVAILEAYGRLLVSVGDVVEAGKYLYLSGIRAPAYAEPIALFTQRHAKRRGKDFVMQFPTVVRRQPFAALPVIVQDDLRQRGVTPDMLGTGAPRPRSNPPVSSLVWNAVGTLIAGVFILALLLGSWTMLSWVGAFLFSR
jgi:hypothetical protein